VATAKDIEEAILWLGVFHPDLLLIDSGLSTERMGIVVAVLRQDSRNRYCKIVVLSNGPRLTAFPDADHVETDAVLEKPLRLKDLLQTVQLLVNGGLDTGSQPIRHVPQSDVL
jgi:CheY-like chemotaxis protein